MSWRIAALVALGVVAGILVARAAQDAETGTASWDGLRAAGFAAYLCLWIGVCTGIAVHMRYRPGPVALTWLLETHRMSSALGVSFALGHIAGLLVDPTVSFSVVDIAIGLTSGYRPLQVTLGVATLWLMAAVLASTAMAASMPYSIWRNIHWLSFPAYLFALFHGLTAGTDGTAAPALATYAVTAAGVSALLVARVLGRGWVSEPG